MISIIIPTYNEAAHVEATLQHLINLEEQPLEIIVAAHKKGGTTGTVHFLR